MSTRGGSGVLTLTLKGVKKRPGSHDRDFRTASALRANCATDKPSIG